MRAVGPVEPGVVEVRSTEEVWRRDLATGAVLAERRWNGRVQQVPVEGGTWRLGNTVERCGVGFDLQHRVVQKNLDDFLA